MRIQSDQEWFNALFLEHYQTLFHTAALLLRQESVAEELVDETFLRLWDKREQLRAHPHIDGWLYVTLKNLICNETRLAKYQKETPLLFEAGTEGGIEAPDTLAALLPEGLSAAERQILILCFEQQLSYEEISEILGISVLACRTRLCRAKAHYRKLIEEQQSENL